MKRLLPYKETIYDTNCIIYQCFKTKIVGKKGEIEIGPEPFTAITRSITVYISQNRKNILTLKQAIEEIKKRVVVIAVKKETNRKEIRESYGLSELERFPEDIELRIIQRLLIKINSFVKKDIYVENAYRPNKQDVRVLQNFYDVEVPNDPSLKAKCKPNGSLSRVDEDLVLFSKDRKAPLITNDYEIYCFNTELEQRKLCFKIFPLLEFKISST